MAATTEVKALQIQVDASVELLRRNLAQGGVILEQFERRGQKSLDRFDDRMKRVGDSGMPAVKRAIDGVRVSLGALAAGLGVVGIGAAGKQFLELADKSKLMHAQLVLATSQFGSLGQAQADTERIAANTRIGIEATTQLYGTMLRAAAPLGKTQADAATATETFSKALKIGGAGAAEAASATLQFSQALASGVLRGDEFNSIAEASPRILRLLADAMGVPQGALRAMAAEGKLTADKLYDALTNTKVTAGLDAEFKQLPVTMSEAMTLVGDAAIKTAGAFDRGSELSSAIASLVTGGADGFGNMADAAERAGVDIRATFIGLSNLFDPMRANANDAFGDINSGIGTLREAVAGLLDLLDVIPNQAVRITNRINAFGNAMKAATRDQHPWLAPFVAPDTPEIGEYNNGAIFRQNAARARLTQSVRRQDAEVRQRYAKMFGAITRNPDGSLDLGVIAPPARSAPPKPATPKRSGGRGRKSTAKPFTFDAADPLATMMDPATLKDAQRRAVDRAADQFDAIFGTEDPMAEMVADANRARDESLSAWAAGWEKQLGPLEQYRDELRSATGDMRTSLENVAVNGFASLESGLVSIIDGTRSVGEAFSDMATGIVSDLARIAVQKAVVAAIGSIIPGGSSFFGLKDGGPLASIPGRADGGSLGGLISGPGNGRSDSILALLSGPGGGAVRLSNREFIMNERAVQYYGADTMAAINGRRLPRFADGGSLSAPSTPVNLSVARAPSLASLASDGTGGANGNVTVSIALSDDLDARIDNRAAGVAVQVVRNNAPQIVEAATVATVATLNRSSL